MHANELVLMAAKIADRVHFAPEELDWRAFDLESYWSASRHRLERWDAALKAMKAKLDEGQDQQAILLANQDLLEEVLLSDVHCRIWTAAFHQAVDQHSTQASVSVVRSIWIGQQESRCKVLRILAKTMTDEIPIAVELNRLRRKTERWNDVMLAQLGQDVRLEMFAIDRERVHDFQQTARDPEQHHPSSWPLFHASISHAFPTGTDSPTSPELNQLIHDSMLHVVGDNRVGTPWHTPGTAGQVLNRLEETSRQMEDWLANYLE